MDLAERLIAALSGISLKGWRLSLKTPGVMATLPMVRGVWGAALRELSPEAYREVFEGGDDRARATPAYLLRPTQPEDGEHTAIEWLLFGQALRWEGELLRAWDIASGMGLDKERRRFFIRNRRVLTPDGRPVAEATAGQWELGQACWPLTGAPATTPITLDFEVPLRLVRRQVLIEQPGLTDITQAALRRFDALGPGTIDKDLRDRCLSAARKIHILPWVGSRLDLQRYSARQNKEIELHGSRGGLGLPEGPGPLWPLFAGLQWTHVGKGTVFGLGQPILRRLGPPNRTTEPSATVAPDDWP